MAIAGKKGEYEISSLISPGTLVRERFLGMQR
jgi:hypothetical protein